MPLFAGHLQEIAYHFGKAEEYLGGASFYLEQHEAQHPLVQSLLEHLPSYEGIYGPIFLYLWMPISAWAGDLTLLWWDGPSASQLATPPYFHSHTIVQDRHYTRSGLQTLLDQWCKKQRKDPAQFSLVSQGDGRSVLLEGYVPPTSEQFQAWTVQNEFMEWADRQPLPSVKLVEEK